MSEKDELKKLQQRVDELVRAVKLIHGHVEYQPSCAVCQALWRAQ
jgi:hypothetical protein